MKAYFFGLAIAVSGLADIAFAGPSISGGADVCSSKPLKYECTAHSDTATGQSWPRAFMVTDEGTQQVTDRLEVGICEYEPEKNGLGMRRYAWGSLHSQTNSRVHALAQTDFPEAQRDFNLTIYLADGDAVEYYYIKCSKIN